MDQIKKHSKYEKDSVIALGRSGSHAKIAVPAIMEALDGTDIDTWILVPNVLREIGAPPESVMPNLDAKLRSDRAWPSSIQYYRLEFAEQILNIEPTDRAAQSFMIGLITHDTFFAPYAIRWFSEFKSPPQELFAAIQKATKNRERTTRQAAIAALRKINSPSAGRTNSTAN